MEFNTLVPEGAGILDQIIEIAGQEAHCCNASVFYQNQYVLIHGHKMTIEKISEKESVLIFTETIPADVKVGDFIVLAPSGLFPAS